MSRATITMSASAELTAPAADFIFSYMGELNAAEKQKELVRAAALYILSLLSGRNTGRSGLERPIEIEVSDAEGKITVSFLNHGTPVYLNAAPGRASDADFTARFREAMTGMDSVTVENLGRAGQKIRIETAIGEKARRDRLSAGAPAHEEDQGAAGGVEVRELRPGEEFKLSRLFYSVYEYNYINEAVYYPEKLRALIDAGRLISMVGVSRGGRILGHVGLVKCGETPPVYEAALGLVDPGVKSKGLFGKIFHATMERAAALPMQYCVFDFVTNHDLSQTLISRYGTADMALLVGCQTKATQASLTKLGIGADPEDMDRYTILFSIIPRVAHPFGSEIVLPESIGGEFGFLLKPLALEWSPEPRFSMLPPAGDYSFQYQPGQSAVLFDLFDPGRAAAARLLGEWADLLKNGCRYAAVDAPVGQPGLGQLFDLLTGHGFSVAGFMPYKYSDRLAVRFQASAPARLALDKIKVASDSARKLLELARRRTAAQEKV